MKLSVTRDGFKTLIGGLSGVAEKRSTMPVLTHLHLQTDGDLLEVCATDLEIRKTMLIEAIIEEPGEALIPAATLKGVVAAASLERIELETLPGHRIEVRAGEYLVKIACLDPADFPASPDDAEVEALDIEASDLQAMVSACLHAVSRAATNGHFCGVRLLARGDITLAVASDGKRLSLAGKRLGGTLAAAVTVPLKGAEEIAQLDSAPVRFVRAARYLGLAQGGLGVTIRVLEGDYPDFTRALPTDSAAMATVAGPDFLAAVRRVALFSGGSGVLLSVQRSFILISAGNGDNEATDSVECTLHGEPLDIRFHGRFLIDALASLPEGDVFLKFNGSRASVAIIPGNMAGWDERLCVVAPMEP